MTMMIGFIGKGVAILANMGIINAEKSIGGSRRNKMGYKIKVTDYQTAYLTERDVMSISEAARVLDMTMPGVIRAIERGALTEVIDDSAAYHGRRLVFRKEIERLVSDRSGEKSAETGAANGAKPKTSKAPAPAAISNEAAEKTDRLKESRVSFYLNRPRNDTASR
jgi:hypothetical protein